MNDNMNLVMAINMGGDDFITKPFDLNVLTVKIQAMLRRTYEFAGESHMLEHQGVVAESVGWDTDLRRADTGVKQK